MHNPLPNKKMAQIQAVNAKSFFRFPDLFLIIAT